MWARVRGETENAVLRLPFKTVAVIRPAGIIPLHGITSQDTALPRRLHADAAALAGAVQGVSAVRDDDRAAGARPAADRETRRAQTDSRSARHQRADRERPRMIQQLSAPELKAMIDSGTPFEFVDVRNQWERDIAAIDGIASARPGVPRLPADARSPHAARVPVPSRHPQPGGSGVLPGPRVREPVQPARRHRRVVAAGRSGGPAILDGDWGLGARG